MNIELKRDEFGRQRALDNLDILDTPKERPFEKIVDLVRQTLSVPISAVSLIDRDRQWFKASRGLAISETRRDVSFCAHAIESIESFVIPDVQADARFSSNPLVLGEPGIRSYAGVPLTMPDGYNVGALCAIDTKPRDFSDQEISILNSFGRIVVDEIGLRQIASTDALTGVMSRRAWIEAAEAELGRSGRYERPLSVMIVDVDHFKAINDTFGHNVGDMVLKQLAQVLTDGLRQFDQLGRLGGEEFAVLLPETDADAAIASAERMRSLVENRFFADLDGRRCTISAGVAEAGPEGDSLPPLLDRADKALYRAKANGRNRVEIAVHRSDERAGRHFV